MPTPISTTRTGTGWTIDVTSLALSSDLGYKDFYVKVSGVASPLTNYTKTSAVLLTYGGVALGSNTPVVVYRDSSRLVDDLVFSDVNSSSGLNSRFTQIEKVLEDLRQMVVP
jgi:hypothetical protein